MKRLSRFYMIRMIVLTALPVLAAFPVKVHANHCDENLSDAAHTKVFGAFQMVWNGICAGEGIDPVGQVESTLDAWGIPKPWNLQLEATLTDDPTIKLADIEAGFAGARVNIWSTHGKSFDYPALAAEYYLTADSARAAYNAYIAGSYSAQDLTWGLTGDGAWAVCYYESGITAHIQVPGPDAIVLLNACDADRFQEEFNVDSYLYNQGCPSVSTGCENIRTVFDRLGCGRYPFHGHQTDDAVSGMAAFFQNPPDAKEQLDCRRGCLELIFGINDPVSILSDLFFRGDDLCWRTGGEDETFAFRVLGSRDSIPTIWEEISGEIPARGSGSEYRTVVSKEWKQLLIQEKVLRDERIVWSDLFRFRGRNSKSILHRLARFTEKAPLLVVGEAAGEAAMEKYVEEKKAYGFDASYRITDDLTSEALAGMSAGDSRVVIPWRGLMKAPAGTKSAGDPAVLLIAPYLDSNTWTALQAYKGEMTWHGFPASSIETRLLPVPYDSLTLSNWVRSSPARYVLLFGRVYEKNGSETTLPLPWLSKPAMAPIWGTDHALSLWGLESDAGGTAVDRAVGFLPVYSSSDIWRYVTKQAMAYMQTALGRNPYMGLWFMDRDFGTDPAPVSFAADDISALVEPVWTEHVLEGAAIPDSNWCPSCTDSARTDLLRGEAIVGMMSTGSSYINYGHWLIEQDGRPPIDSLLGGSGRVSHFFGLSCRTNDIDLVDAANDSGMPMISRDLLLTDRGGALSSIGPTSGFHQGYYYSYLRESLSRLNGVADSVRIGDLHRDVRNTLLADSPDDTLMTEFAKICALFGDPTLPVYGPGLNPSYGMERRTTARRQEAACISIS